MRQGTRYIISYLLLLLLLRLSLIFPHRQIELPALVNVSLQLLLFLICIDIAIHSFRQQKHVYLHFALFFAFSVFLFLSSFVGTSVLRGSPYSTVYYHVYVNKFGLNFVWLFAIVYALVDYLFVRRRLAVKYAASLSLTLLIVVPLYSPFLVNPLHLYDQDEYATVQKIDEIEKSYLQKNGTTPSNSEIAQELMTKYTPGRNVSESLNQEEDLVAKLQAYVEGGGTTVLFWKPINQDSILVQGIIIVILCVFFVGNYLLNKPHSAYLDKILFLFALLSLVEITHLLTFISTTTFASYHTVFTVAQYITVVCLVIMIYAFDLRLRFVLSPTGTYYEETLYSAPERVTRWRDEIDNIILKTFFDIRKYNKHLGHYNDRRQL